MIVIDEAHQHPPGTPLYELYRGLSQRTEGLLVLSATPSKRETQGIFGLLSLVAPDQYPPGHESRLEALWLSRQEIWDRLGYHQALREAPDFEEMPQSAMEALAEDWAPLLDADETAGELLRQLRRGERAAFDELEAYVQEHYRIDHRIIRTRRRTVLALGQHLCERRLEVVEYDPGPGEALFVEHVEGMAPGIAILDAARRALAAIYLRLLRYPPVRVIKALQERLRSVRDRAASSRDDRWWTELLSDPSPEEEALLWTQILREVHPFPDEERWLEHALALAEAWSRETPNGARWEGTIEWIRAHLRTAPAKKVLVFTEDRDNAILFAGVLGERLKRTVDAFHWVASEEEEEKLRRVTSDFQRRPDRPVLVSDELGGEGRNFQMAEAVIHLECPWSVSRVEQRIGRLDRIGRDADRPVRSVVLLGPGSVERLVHRAHSDVFGVHARSIGGLEFLLPKLQKRIFEAAVSGDIAMTEELNALSAELRSG
ncbi:MAG: helicase-related protein, partial [Blastocatellia bacterium]